MAGAKCAAILAPATTRFRVGASGYAKTWRDRVCHVKAGAGGKFRTAKDRRRTVIHPKDVEKFRKSKRKAGNPDIADHAQAAGRLGGRARAEKLSPKERSKISALGADARWGSS